MTLDEQLENYARKIVSDTLIQTRGNQSEAAILLGCHRATIRRYATGQTRGQKKPANTPRGFDAPEIENTELEDLPWLTK